jgi:hypothetical protein
MNLLKSILAILGPLVKMWEAAWRMREEKRRRAAREKAYDNPGAAMSEHFSMLSKDADDAKQTSADDNAK